MFREGNPPVSAVSDIIKSVSYDQHEIISNIINLFLDGNPIQCDPTFSTGAIWKGLPEPKLKFDIDPKPQTGAVAADCRCLPLRENSLDSLFVDLPFVGGFSNKSEGIIRKRFGSYKNIPAIWQLYWESLQEFYRVLKSGAYLVFKCQDGIDGGLNYLTHVEVILMAYSLGFYPRDLFILVAKTRLVSGWKNQYHARKFHSYFLVLEKAKSKVKYGEFLKK